MSSDLPYGFPLAWPADWPRSDKRGDSPYRVSFVRARDDLFESMSRFLRTKKFVVTSNVPVSLAGRQYAGFNPADPGVAVWWRQGTDARALACDQWKDVRSNLRALGLSVEALHQLRRSGAGQIVERAELSFHSALPAPFELPWLGPLGLTGKPTLEEIRAAFLRLVKEHHPDQGGDPEKFMELKRAYDAALKWAGGV